MTGADGARQSVDRLRKQFFKFLKTASTAPCGIRVGENRSQRGACEGEQQSFIVRQRFGDYVRGSRHHGRADDGKDQDIACANAKARLFEDDLQFGDPLGAAQEGVEGGDPAKHLVPQQRQSFASGGLRLGGGQAVADQARAFSSLVQQHSGGERHSGDREKNQDGDDCQHGALY